MKYLVPIVIWLVLIGLFVAAKVYPTIPGWSPVVLYALVVGVRVNEKFWNHIDEVKMSQRNERIRLGEIASDMANRGLTFSSMRKGEEKKVQEEFEHERKRSFRKFTVELANSIFLF